MNYRHAFHAGNFADVFKHALLARMLVHLAAKPAAFRYHDTHAGLGLYDLSAAPSRRGAEAAGGVGAFLRSPAAADALFAPYVAALRAFNALDGRFYPGSPMIAAHLLRPSDRLSLAELHPEDGAVLKRRFARDRRAGVTLADGYRALSAWLPPPERRGLVLVDPPFERDDEWMRMAEALQLLTRKWATGTMALWYPIKDWRPPDRFHRRVTELAIPKTLRLELLVDAEGDPDRLNGCGYVIANPPWRLREEAQHMLPLLAQALRQGQRASWRADWLVDETGA